MLHLHLINVFDHYIFKQMQKMTSSGMVDFDRANYKHFLLFMNNFLFSAIYPFLFIPNLLSRKTSNSSSKKKKKKKDYIHQNNINEPVNFFCRTLLKLFAHDFFFYVNLVLIQRNSPLVSQ